MTSAAGGPPPPQRVSALAEDQYRFGIGPILVRGVQILEEVIVDGEPWVHVKADVAMGTKERPGPWFERELDIPVAVMHKIGARR